LKEKWEKISGGRLQKQCKGFVIIKPENAIEGVPFFCPVCKKPMKKAHDTQAFHSYGCCATCEVLWVRNREEQK